MKSDIEIAKWVYRRIKDSELAAAVTGKLSDRGRPAGSTLEDIVVSVLASDGSGDAQTAFVNVNVYVSDLWNSNTKAWERDTIRVGELCELSKSLFTLFGGDFRVVPKQSSQRVLPTGVTFEDGHTEHFINNKLFIKISND